MFNNTNFYPCPFNIQYEQQNNLNAKVEELEEEILKLEQQNEELRRASEEEKSEVAKYQFVDLGLSVKWATCNVGANSPEEYGGYYGGFDDAQNFRVPSKEDFENLIKNCDWTWTTKNGVHGYKVTSRKNGNSIFLPAAGWYRFEYVAGASSVGLYRSSNTYIIDDIPMYDWYLIFDSDSIDVDYEPPFCLSGISVRLVQDVK